jgi:hypothetical protein
MMMTMMVSVPTSKGYGLEPENECVSVHKNMLISMQLISISIMNIRVHICTCIHIFGYLCINQFIYTHISLPLNQ